MKVAPNFDIREFVPKWVWDAFGANSIWFINQRIILLAQFYKDWFTAYFKKHSEKPVKTVAIVINDWHYRKGGHQYRGFRPWRWGSMMMRLAKKFAELSQHFFGNAFDCDIIIIYEDGTREEVNYKTLHMIIQDHWEEFKAAGLTTLEDVKIANTWLHSDCRNTNQEELLIVGA